MKSLPELFEAIRNCSAVAHLKYFDRTQTSEAKADAFETGHSAACDRLIPVITEAFKYIQGVADRYGLEDYRNSCDAKGELLKLRELLERGAK